jgi:2-aminoadipate transaminase
MPDSQAPTRAPARAPFARWLGTTNEVTRGFLAAGRVQGLINLGGGLPPAETYPTGEMAGLAVRAIRDHAAEALGYGPVEGLPALRDALAARLSSETVRLTRDNVLVTTSGLAGLDHIGKALLDEGATVAVQSPTYLGALDAWRPRQPSLRPMDLADPSFEAASAFAGARFAYTVPNFSNPTGRLVPLEQRHALVAAAESTGTWLVEDDPYGTLLYEGAPLPRLLDLAGDGGPYTGPVIYLGTVSKEIAPGLRLGWIVAAPEAIEALTLAKQGSDMCTSGITQHILLGALAAGLPERMQPGIVALYRDRRDALLAAMEAHLSDHFNWERPVGGMFVWAEARDPTLDTDALHRAALRAGVAVSPSSAFDPEGRNRRAIRLNFTLNPPDRLAEGIARLAAAVREIAT